MGRRVLISFASPDLCDPFPRFLLPVFVRFLPCPLPPAPVPPTHSDVRPRFTAVVDCMGLILPVGRQSCLVSASGRRHPGTCLQLQHGLLLTRLPHPHPCPTHRTRLRLTIQGHTDWIFGSAWVSENHLVTCSKDTSMALWAVDPNGSDSEEIPTITKPLVLQNLHKVSHVLRFVLANGGRLHGHRG